MWWASALILSPIISDHSLSHYLPCMLLHQKNICEHYLTNWSLNEPLAEGAFGLPLGSQSGCRRKPLTDAKRRLGERADSCQLPGRLEGTGVRKGGGEAAMNHVLQENSPSLKEAVLLAPTVKLFNSLGTSRGKFKPLWNQRRKNCSRWYARQGKKAGKTMLVILTTFDCQEPTGVPFTIVLTGSQRAC